MIYEEADTVMLAAVKYDIADITTKRVDKNTVKRLKTEFNLKRRAVKNKKTANAVQEVPKFQKVGKHKGEKEHKTEKDSVKNNKQGKKSMLDIMLRCCGICLLVVLTFTALNLAGIDSVITNLKQIIENRSIDVFLVNAEFV